MASLTVSTMALFTMGNMKKKIKCFKFHETFKYHISRKSTKLRRLVIGGVPHPYPWGHPLSFCPTAIKIKQPSSILRHPTSSVLPKDDLNLLYSYLHFFPSIPWKLNYCNCKIVTISREMNEIHWIPKEVWTKPIIIDWHL